MFLYMFNFYCCSQLLLLMTKVGSYESMYQVHETKKTEPHLPGTKMLSVL